MNCSWIRSLEAWMEDRASRSNLPDKARVVWMDRIEFDHNYQSEIDVLKLSYTAWLLISNDARCWSEDRPFFSSSSSNSHTSIARRTTSRLLCYHHHAHGWLWLADEDCCQALNLLHLFLFADSKILLPTKKSNKVFILSLLSTSCHSLNRSELQEYCWREMRWLRILQQTVSVNTSRTSPWDLVLADGVLSHGWPYHS